MTINDVVLAAQYELNDYGVRWPKSRLASYASQAQIRAYELCPSLFLSFSGNSIFEPTDDSELDTALLLSVQYVDCLASYVCYRALREDGNDAADVPRSGRYMSNFTNFLVSK